MNPNAAEFIPLYELQMEYERDECMLLLALEQDEEFRAQFMSYGISVHEFLDEMHSVDLQSADSELEEDELKFLENEVKSLEEEWMPDQVKSNLPAPSTLFEKLSSPLTFLLGYLHPISIFNSLKSTLWKAKEEIKEEKVKEVLEEVKEVQKPSVPVPFHKQVVKTNCRYEKLGGCKNPSCKFLHGVDRIRCRNGDRCKKKAKCFYDH